MHNKNQVANEYEVKSYLRSNGWKSPITKIYSKVVITSRAMFNERASKQASNPEHCTAPILKLFSKYSQWDMKLIAKQNIYRLLPPETIFDHLTTYRDGAEQRVCACVFVCLM